MKLSFKHITALTALLILLIIGWIVAYPMVVGVNNFGVVLGGVLPSLLFVASIVTALYFVGQGKSGFGRVIATGIAFAFLFCVICILLLAAQILLVKNSVSEAALISIYSIFRCAAWVFLFWLAIGRLTHKKEKTSTLSNSAKRTFVLVIACMLAATPFTLFSDIMLNSSPLISALTEVFGLIVWWFLAVACIWRFSFGVAAGKTTPCNETSALDMPVFRYQPLAYTNGVFSLRKKGDTCPCCGQYTAYYYEPEMHTTHKISRLCPNCISDGSAAETFSGTFVKDAEPVTDPMKFKELTNRTPGFKSRQGEYWLSCCDDYCAFIGQVDINELEKMGIADEVLTEHARKHSELDRELVQKSLSKQDFVAGYLFTCLHCGAHRLWIDAD